MASIPLATSRQIAIDRIIEVMQATLGPKLQSLKDDPANGIEELNLRAPQTEAYYYAPMPIEDLPKNRYPCVFVFPSDRRVLDSSSTSGPLGQTQFRTFQLTAVLIYIRDAGEKFSRLNKTLTTDDIMWLRGEFYTGAMAHVIRRFACQGDAIHKIELVSDLSEVVETDRRKVYGVSQVLFDVTQKIVAPNRAPLPPGGGLQIDLQGGLG